MEKIMMSWVEDPQNQKDENDDKLQPSKMRGFLFEIFNFWKK